MIAAKSAIAYLKKKLDLSVYVKIAWDVVDLLWGQVHGNSIVKCTGLSASHFTNMFYNFVNKMGKSEHW